MGALHGIITPWSARLEAGAASIMPDGCRDLILSIHEHAPPRLILTGLDDTPRQIHNSAPTEYIGLRLHPAAHFARQGNGNGDSLLTVDDEDIGPWVETLLRQPQRAEELLFEAAERWCRIDEEFFNTLHSDSLSERQMRRRITQQTGRSPIYWRRLQRARAAAKAILDSNSPLSEIAAEYDFSDQAHLSREMRHWFELTPGQLRMAPERYLHQFTSPDAFTL